MTMQPHPTGDEVRQTLGNALANCLMLSVAVPVLTVSEGSSGGCFFSRLVFRHFWQFKVPVRFHAEIFGCQRVFMGDTQKK